jgi:hypothetical protein
MSTEDRHTHHEVWNAANSRRYADPQQQGDPAGRRQPSQAGPPPQGGTVRPGVSWPLVLGLGALALVRPLARVTGLEDSWGTPATALLLTFLVTGTWAAVVGLGRVPRPVLTLTLAGLAYGIYVIPLSAVLSVGLTGTLQGPLAVPFAVVPVLATNALWGAVAGLLALAVQSLRREKS